VSTMSTARALLSNSKSQPRVLKLNPALKIVE